MDIRKIRTFVHIAELGSYSRAATFLHVSQPALSRQMRLLEGELNLSLFHRHGHGVELTDEGLAFLDRCRDVLMDFEQLRQDFRSRVMLDLMRKEISRKVTAGEWTSSRLIKPSIDITSDPEEDETASDDHP
jgi:LysR family nitrogen assimilation transcriptional regulator